MAHSGMKTRLVVDGVPCYWVDTLAQAEDAVVSLRVFDVVAVDVEGANLGHGGRVATIQLCGGMVMGEEGGECYVIDVDALGMPDCVRWLLESGANTAMPGPLKLCHAFDGDQTNLIEQFGLDFSSSDLFDTQSALKHLQGETEGTDAARKMSRDDRKASRSGPYADLKKGLLDILGAFCDGFDASEAGAEMQAVKTQLRYVNFFERPLSDKVLRYMCRDVLFLEGAYRTMKPLLLALVPTDKSEQQKILDSVLADSRYCGPYAKGVCYRPPTDKQRERQALKGKKWSEEERDWVRAS